MLKALNEQLKKNGGEHGAVIGVYHYPEARGIKICYADGYWYPLQIFYDN